MDVMERFMAKVSPEPNTGCWLWTAHVDQGGYARFGLNGKPRSAHRTSYEMFIGPIPKGLDLDHLCRMRCCVNPDHLEPVTRRVNCNRGVGPRQAGDRVLAITHCPSGHPYAGENLVVNLSGAQAGARRCKTCKSLQYRKWRMRRDAQEAFKCHF